MASAGGDRQLKGGWQTTVFIIGRKIGTAGIMVEKQKMLLDPKHKSSVHREKKKLTGNV